jgi:hypothetical protein
MQVIERKKNLHKTRLEEIFSESMTRVAIEKIPETIPHGFLDETVMVLDGFTECMKFSLHVCLTSQHIHHPSVLIADRCLLLPIEAR